MLKKIICALLISLTTSQFALANTTDLTLQQNINQTIKKFNQDINIGIVVQSMNTGKILYQRNPNLVFNTASSMKLFTAVAALSYLGPDFTFVTQLASDSSPTNGILPGNLYIRFTGDPALTTEDLNK